jgi:4-hydroxybenzoate polyprenyltransferase
MTNFYNYLKIARPDHWIKQLFIIPGMVIAFFLIGKIDTDRIVFHIIFGFLSTCFIASQNYVINYCLDA